MLDADGEILYVGKARNLKSRVGSYFQPSNVQPKVQALVAKTARMEVTITNSDTEALLLEFNLIKKHRPRFNVVLRDDKSFPYLHFETQHEFPRLNFYRGSRKEPGRYFGPYPSAGAVRETLQQLQKLFRLRNCDDTYFANRSRPCLQYQIQRCTAPCVGLISKENYARDVGAAIKVLEGRNDEVRLDLGRRMEAAAEQLHFEEAAQLRDQLAKLKAVQAQQIVTADIDHDADVIAIAAGNGEYCVAVMFVRAGRSLGSTTFFPKAPFAELPEVLAAFVTQYYLERESPAEIIVEQEFDEMPLLEATLAQRSGHKVRIAAQVRGIRARWLEMMHNNAEQALDHARPGARQHRVEPRRFARCLRSRGDAEPHRVLRHQPHGRHRHRRFLRGIRRGGSAQERISALQYRRDSTGRRLCRHVSGTDAALQARARRRGTANPMCCSSTAARDSSPKPRRCSRNWGLRGLP